MVMAFQLPGWKSWQAERSGHEKMTCLHCHQLNDVLRQPAIDAKTFDKRRDVEVWPLPENVGITLDRDDGLLVKAVEPNSAAARAGIRAGDHLGAAGGRRLFGQADFRGVLHRGPRDAGRIELVWLRDGKSHEGALEVGPGWRKTVIDWRMSLAEGNIGASPGFFPLPSTPPNGSSSNSSKVVWRLSPIWAIIPTARPTRRACAAEIS